MLDEELRGQRVLGPVELALVGSHVERATLILEIVPPFEASDEVVLEGLERSIEYWRQGLDSLDS